MVQGPQTTLLFQRPTVTNSAYGTSQAWSDLVSLTGVLSQSRMTRNRSLETIKSDKETIYGRYTFYCDFPVGVTLDEQDRAVLGSRSFEVIFVYNPGNKNQYLEIELDEIK